MGKWLLGILTTIAVAQASATTLNIPGKPGDGRFSVRILEEFVKRSPNYDAVHHYYGNAGDPAQSKMMADLELGNVDLVWMGTTAELEQTLTPVYVPIYRGLLGMRLAIVERDKQELFSQVKSVSQLNRYVACQGKTWGDTTILEANGVKVAKSLKYPNLFYMLEGDRCDYFPRGFFEPFGEVKNQAELNLVVDKHLVIRYKSPLFYFTAKSNPALADELTEVFAEMYQDGTFNKLFFETNEIKQSLKLSELENRTILDLTNPGLTEETNNIQPAYWFDPTTEAY